MILTQWIPGALGAACLLALAFHRNRLGFILLLALLIALALSTRDVRLVRGAISFGALFLLWAAVMREPALRSRRAGIYFLSVLLLMSFTLYAPPHIFRGLHWFFSMAWLLPSTTQMAGWIIAVAAAATGLRWILSAALSEWIATIVLALLAVVAALASMPKRAEYILAIAALFSVLGVLWSSYRMAFVDSLSNLLNRRALDETLARIAPPYSIAMIDIDHFKKFNDTHGHDAGDIVLREVARRIKRHSSGKVFRFGGEEFCVVWFSTESETIKANCENIRAHVADFSVLMPANFKNKKAKEHHVTVSLGYALAVKSDAVTSLVLKSADQALYRAKNQGRNCSVMAS